MSSFTDIKSDTRKNLNDSGVTLFSNLDIDDSFQDAYDDIVALTQCIIKRITLNWQAELSYYDFRALTTDFIACVAIFNNVTNQWLDDSYSCKDFDQLQDNWEVWIGTPLNWAASNFQYTAICPKYATAAGTFDLYYWASAPIVVDGQAPQIATDFQYLLEKYSTADLLEQFEEFVSAGNFWNLYVEHLEKYRERVKNLVKTDLLMRI